jgi:hypothetical protein
MANATKATTALVAVALGLATVTAAFVTISSTASVAEAPAVKIQDRLKSEVRLISIDDADASETTVVRSDPVTAETVAVRVVPLPVKAPRAAALTVPDTAGKADAAAPLASGIPLPQPKPVEMAAIDVTIVPLPLPRPNPEMVVGSLTTAEAMTPR